MANAQFDSLACYSHAGQRADVAEIEKLVTITDAWPGQLLLDHAAGAVRSTWPSTRRPALSYGVDDTITGNRYGQILRSAVSIFYR